MDNSNYIASFSIPINNISKKYHTVTPKENLNLKLQSEMIGDTKVAELILKSRTTPKHLEKENKRFWHLKAKR